MADHVKLTGLKPRDAVADAIHRCVHDIDTNDKALFVSGCVKDSKMLLIAGPIKLEGYNIVNDYFQRVFSRVTTHIVSNIRIELKDGADTAHMTAHALAYHIRLDEALKKEDTSYTSSWLYNIDPVKDGNNGLWKIKRWELKIQWTTGDFKVLCSQAEMISWQSLKPFEPGWSKMCDKRSGPDIDRLQKRKDSAAFS